MSANISFTPGDATRRHELYRYDPDGLGGVQDGVLVTTLAPGISSYVDPDGDAELHAYGACALGDGDPSDIVLSAVPVIEPPDAPTGLTVTPDGSDANDLAWMTAEEIVTEIFANFERGAFSLLHTTAVLPSGIQSYGDEGLPTPGANGYRVRTSDAGGESPWCDHKAQAPYNCSADLGVLSRTVNWILGGGNPDLCVHVKVERRIDGDFWEPVATLDPNETTWEDTDDLTLQVGLLIEYRVYEETTLGDTGMSNVASGLLIL